jgi:hypothetical protein
LKASLQRDNRASESEWVGLNGSSEADTGNTP